MDAPGNDGNASMPEHVKRPNPWRKMLLMMMIILMMIKFTEFQIAVKSGLPALLFAK